MTDELRIQLLDYMLIVQLCDNQVTGFALGGPDQRLVEMIDSRVGDLLETPEGVAMMINAACGSTRDVRDKCCAELIRTLHIPIAE